MAVQEKSGLPKHLQHQRLQREEDEEQWISGEELITDGSSDEETSQNDLKKLKKKTTPKKEEATAITNVGGEKTLEVPENLGETLIQWRPKRGSMKLPMDEIFMPKSGNFNVKLAKWEMLDSFDKTREELEKLKSDFQNALPPIFNVNSSDNFTFEADESEFNLRKNIETCENDLKMIIEHFTNNKAERLKCETEICESLKEFNLNPNEYLKNNKFFEICNFENDLEIIDEENKAKLVSVTELEIKEESDEEIDEYDLKNIEILQVENEKTEESNKSKKKKENNKSENTDEENVQKRTIQKIDFIANEKKKLLNFKMTGCSMTDEEKTRLNLLLADLNEENTENEVINICLQYENGFKRNDEEKQNIEEIDKKLKILEEQSKKGHHLFEIQNSFQEFSRYNGEKLKEIDEKLEKIKTENDINYIKT